MRVKHRPNKKKQILTTPGGDNKKKMFTYKCIGACVGSALYTKTKPISNLASV